MSLVSVPQLISAPLLETSNAFLQNIGRFLSTNFHSFSFGYNFLYFILVFVFAYLYTAFQFKPEDIADDLKRSGGFIPGIRPGIHTQRYLKNIVTKITLAGALFLGLIAILPYIMRLILGIDTLTVGGTGLLIVVSVTLEIVRKIQSLAVTRDYDRYIS